MLFLDSKQKNMGFILIVFIFVTYQPIVKFEYCYVAI